MLTEQTKTFLTSTKVIRTGKTQGTFTKQHVKFYLKVTLNGKEHKTSYQFNPVYSKYTKNSFLACLVSDAFSYYENIDPSGDDLDTLQNFFNCFGYSDNLKEGLQAFKGCKDTYNFLKDAGMTDAQLQVIYDDMLENEML